jgi:thiamine kinase-like enzyme
VRAAALAPHAPAPVRTVDDLDAAWLAAALGSGPVSSFEAERIGTGQMSESHRIRLRYAAGAGSGPRTAVLKLASSDRTSRATGLGLGIYEREVRFYRELAPRIGGPLPHCWAAAYDDAEGWFTLLLGDAAPARAGDQIAGCDAAQARVALDALARLHAPVLEDPQLAASGWLNRPSPITGALVAGLLPQFLQRYGERVAPEHRALCERFVARVDGWLGLQRSPQGLVHGDYRLDNLLFADPDGASAVTVVDWQTVGWGSAMADAAYFIGGGLAVGLRRSCERDLFDGYHEALRENGARAPDAEKCWHEYRLQCFGGVVMAIVAAMVVQRTERGDDMFMAMLARHCQQALDLDSEKVLAEVAGDAAAPLRPHGDDEPSHEPGEELLWNESWYFDVVAEDASLGAYVRLGHYPNLGVSWYTAFVCGPGRPTFAVVDFAAPAPTGDDLEVCTPLLRASQRCAVPLQRFDVSLAATAQAHADAAGLLHGATGDATPLELELRWETDGEPFGYRMTTRYEIPCLVSGWIRAGDERFQLAAEPGQRDHSWGLRDWWSMDWVWSAARLQDGTRLHAVQLRLPNLPPLGVGYVQAPGRELLELQAVGASERTDESGLIADADLELQPGDLRLEVRPLAFGPLRLVSPDRRVSHFPRAMCRVRCADGRAGLGWVEWNLNQPPGATGASVVGG